MGLIVFMGETWWTKQKHTSRQIPTPGFSAEGAKQKLEALEVEVGSRTTFAFDSDTLEFGSSATPNG